MKEKVIAVFDIGKTVKKILLFNFNLGVISENEEKFSSIKDDDGFECENIDSIEKWIIRSVSGLLRSDIYDLIGINFVTYESAMVYLDNQGRRVAPVYNYLKPLDNYIPDLLYNKYGGKVEFCRETASIGSGMQNAGLQVLWLKMTKPDFYSKTRYILHLPQYLSYLLTSEVYSEHTSIGCHTSLWDFDNMKYHKWVKDECLPLPEPVSILTVKEVSREGKKLMVGIGINSKAASLVPYFSSDEGKFVVISTGQRSVTLNPFNSESLTKDQLLKNCFCYLNIYMKPVKCSMFRLGQLHDAAVNILSKYFKIQVESFKLIKPDVKLLGKLSLKYKERRVFFSEGDGSGIFKEEIDLFEFNNFVEGYHVLMVELCDLTVNATESVLTEYDDSKVMYITGNFADNDIFKKLIASSFPYMKVYTSSLKNAAALGAAWVVLDSIKNVQSPIINLGLREVTI
jgi:hypothetical protein